MRDDVTADEVRSALEQGWDFVNLMTGEVLATDYDPVAAADGRPGLTAAYRGTVDPAELSEWAYDTVGTGREFEALRDALAVGGARRYSPTPGWLFAAASVVADDGQGEARRWWACGVGDAAAALYALGECGYDPCGTYGVASSAAAAQDPIRLLSWAGASNFGRRLVRGTADPLVRHGTPTFAEDDVPGVVSSVEDPDGRRVSSYAPGARDAAAWALSAQCAYDAGLRGEALRDMVRDAFPRPLAALRAGAALLGLPCFLEGPLGEEARRRHWDLGARQPKPPAREPREGLHA